MDATTGPNPAGNYIATVQALLAAGTDVTTTNTWGENLIALAGSNSAVGDLLRAHGSGDTDD
jgi:hypothetical protein